MNLKSLLKDTAIYGLSSIVGRFLNYLLVPLYTYKMSVAGGGYGIVTNCYAYTAIALAVLTFGMETTLFRFANRADENSDMVYSTALRLVGSFALVFALAVFAFLGPISSWMGYPSHPEYVGALALITGMDAFQAIMFSRLRQQGKALRFMSLKMSFIIPSILVNLLIFSVLWRVPSCAWMFERFDDGAGLVLFANVLCTFIVMLLFVPEIKGIRYGFDRALSRRMLSYAWPIMILSVMGILNQVADKIILPRLMDHSQLAIYGACVKVAMIMALLTQAFRYAYEPIVFRDSASKKTETDTLADGMKYFVIFTLIAYLAVVFYMPIIRHFIAPSYWEGLGVVEIVMAAEIFMGIYFNLSFWYKLTDRTYWGTIISAIGAATMIGLNFVLIPRIGYYGCAWAGLAGYGISMLISWCMSLKYMPVAYDYKTIGAYVAGAVVCVALYKLPIALWSVGQMLSLLWGTVLLCAYCAPIALQLVKKIKK